MKTPRTGPDRMHRSARAGNRGPGCRIPGTSEVHARRIGGRCDRPARPRPGRTRGCPRRLRGERCPRDSAARRRTNLVTRDSTAARRPAMLAAGPQADHAAKAVPSIERRDFSPSENAVSARGQVADRECPHADSLGWRVVIGGRRTLLDPCRTIGNTRRKKPRLMLPIRTTPAGDPRRYVPRWCSPTPLDPQTPASEPPPR